MSATAVALANLKEEQRQARTKLDNLINRVDSLTPDEQLEKTRLETRLSEIFVALELSGAHDVSN
jgi:hypothetical protein